MKERYIVTGNDRITRTDTYLVKVDTASGECFENVEPRRLFPLTDTEHYITLLDSDEHEVALIKDLAALDAESRAAVDACFENYYMIPEIDGILDVDDRFGNLKWRVHTDRGEIEFTIRNRHSDIKLLQDRRLLVRDSNDNRYVISDIDRLDRKSLRKIFSYI